MNAPIEITQELLATLPPELLAELKTARKKTIEGTVHEILCDQGTASTDQLIVAYFMKTGLVMKRRACNGITATLIEKGLIKRVETGVYTVTGVTK